MQLVLVYVIARLDYCNSRPSWNYLQDPASASLSLFLQLHSLPVRRRVQYISCVPRHCVYNGRARTYLDNAVQLNGQSQNNATWSPFWKLIELLCPFESTPNQLPGTTCTRIRSEPDITRFKLSLKTLFFFQTCLWVLLQASLFVFSRPY